MRIRKIEIDSFGKLHGLVLEPGAGITLIEGENESGKSTLLAFLRFVLYGFPRKGSPDGEEREKRLSWQDRTAAGRLTVESGGEQYRILRRCYMRGNAQRATLSEELSVIALSKGEVVELGGRTPGEYFLGLPAELYDGSLSLVQSDAARVCRANMGEAVGELLFTGDAVLSAEEAEDKLQGARRELQHAKGRGGRIAELEDRLAALDGELLAADRGREECERLRAEAARYRALAVKKRERLARIGAVLEQAELQRTLALLEDLEQAEAEEGRCRHELERIGMQAARELPDKEQLQRIGAALRAALDAEEEGERLAPELAQLSAVRHDEKLLSGARVLADKGGEAFLHEAERRTRRIRRRVAGGMLLTLLGVALGAVGYFLLTAWMRYLVGGGALCLAGGMLLLLAGGVAALGRRRSLSQIGASGMPMLRTYILQCEREAKSYCAYAERLTTAQAAQENATRVLTEAMAQLREELATLGQTEMYEKPRDVAMFLEHLTQRKSRLQAELADATVSLERAKGVCEALARRLQGVDREALRARQGMLPSVLPTAVPGEERSALEQELAVLEQRVAEAERAEAALSATVKDPAALQRERAAVREELERATERLEAIRLALDALKAATEELRGGLIPTLQRETEAIFASLTAGAHGALHLHSDLSITLEEEGVPRPLSHFSAGCRDAAHLSLRLALLGTMKKERLPLFFDEAFARLDDKRTAQLLQLLQQYCAGGGQCILLTCHGREGRFLEGDPTVRRFSLTR